MSGSGDEYFFQKIPSINKTVSTITLVARFYNLKVVDSFEESSMVLDFCMAKYSVGSRQQYRHT